MKESVVDRERSRFEEAELHRFNEVEKPLDIDKLDLTGSAHSFFAGAVREDRSRQEQAFLGAFSQHRSLKFHDVVFAHGLVRVALALKQNAKRHHWVYAEIAIPINAAIAAPTSHVDFCESGASQKQCAEMLKPFWRHGFQQSRKWLTMGT